MNNRIDLKEFERAGEAFKFDKIGAKISGTVVSFREPEERTNQFTGADEIVMSITIEQADGEKYSVWPRMRPGSFLQGAVSDALAPYDGNLEIGGTMAVQYIEDRDTGKGRAAKVYAVEYSPPVKQPATMNVDLDPNVEPF